MDSLKLALLCHELADNKKAENTVILDVRKLSSITDFFVITSGSAEPHIRAIIGEITSRLRDEHGIRAAAVDGEHPTSWQVLDYFDVIIHVMKAETRARYDLESLWGDAPRVDVANPPTAEATPKTTKKKAAKKVAKKSAVKKFPAKKETAVKKPVEAKKTAAKKAATNKVALKKKVPTKKKTAAKS
jgi:ribosome-associated protein